MIVKEEINQELYGKTIKKIITNHSDKTDDKDSIIIEFEDDTKYVFTATYGGYTGESSDEYPCFILIGEVKL